MNFENGDKNRPTGNLIIYCHVIGENPLDYESKIIASNVFVSYLNHSNNLPAITFPPVPYKNFQEFEKFLALQRSYDLIKIEDFQFPPEADKAQEYVNRRLQEVNDLVKEYVEVCANYLQGYFEKIPNKPSEVSEIIDKIEYLEKMAGIIRSNLIGTWDEKAFNNLSDYWQLFIDKHPQYPLHNLMQYVNVNSNLAEKLVQLYFRQSKAIYYENYEEADLLQNQISQLTAENE